VTAHVLVLATVALSQPAAVPAATDAVPDAALASGPISARSECRADGEAVLDESGVSQFSLSADPSADFAADFSDGNMGRLFLDLPHASGLEALWSAYLAVRLQRSAAGTLTVGCSLEWSGTPAEESIQLVRDRKPSLSWQTLFAWKALGGSAGH
jgi:hypothetical protein